MARNKIDKRTTIKNIIKSEINTEHVIKNNLLISNTLEVVVALN